MKSENPVRFGVVMDPIQRINPRKDTTLAFLLAAQARGWELNYLEQTDLYLAQGEPRARMRQIKVQDDPEHWFEWQGESDGSLLDLDIILMRKDPPVDDQFIVTTQILDMARLGGVTVGNHPVGLRDCNEKLYATHFPELCPPLIVTSDAARVKAFHQIHKDLVLKPLDGMGGKSIFRVREDAQNLNVIIETLTENGRKPLMAQRFLPEIKAGDKRILMVFGKPVPYALARIPGAGEHRGNLAAGGSGEGRPLTARDLEICEAVSADLTRRGFGFVGLDVIGDYLTEINVTSPTCVRELEKIYGLDIAGDYLDQLLQQRRAG